MGIPDWTWPEEKGLPDSLAATEIEEASDVFAVLSNEIRLELLTTLYQQPAPIPYTELRSEAPIHDNGKLNYHLRELDPFIEQVDGEYALTAAGRDTLRLLVEENEFLTNGHAKTSET
ncbi:MAG: hypothetical protein ACI8U4_000003 [Natronomonas sp.]|jgi:hypothetical protein